jgi:predicted ATPase/DNA-binding SARP family transcriptional activator
MVDRFVVRAFGPLEVSWNGSPVDVRGGLASAIVARLAWTAGVPVAVERLVEALWKEPPANAVGSLRVYVSRLRSGPLGAVLHGGRGGYSLELSRADVDVLRFWDCLDGADALDLDEAHSSADRFASALALWRAEPFEGLSTFPFAAVAAAELRRRRRDALQHLAALRIEQGEPLRAVAEIEPRIAEEPAHEGLVTALARAYAAAGRPSEALTVLDGLRDHVRERTGLDPSLDVSALRQAILRQDASVVSGGSRRDVERYNIPVPLTRMVGRARDLARIEDARSAHRLVTLVGPGGVGKTRLAVESARRSTRTIDERQWMIDLSSVPEGAEVLGTVADQLGASEHSLDAIARRLEGGPVLLILDNAEHVIRSTRIFVVQLLGACAGLAVLTTSREPLGIAGEFVLRIEGLVGPELDQAVELFRERSAAARGGTTPPGHSDGSIRRMCRLLDGLPLALELAAARTAVLSVDDLSAVLDRGEQLPGGAAEPERHGSLENTIRWSTDGLPADEFTLLVELSRFAGPFTLDAVEAICTPGSRPRRDVALSLAHKSLIAAEETEDGQRRYRLLESMKAFARSRDDPGATEEWFQRHRAYFAELVDQLAPAIRTHAAKATHALFDTLAWDLQLATENAIAAQDRDMALRLASGQAWHWFKRGWLVEGRAVVDRALAVPGRSDPSIEARALVGIVNLAYQSGDADAAFEYVRLGIERATEGGDRFSLATLLAYVAYGRSLFGEADQAQALIEQAMASAEGAPDWLMAELLMSKGQTQRASGQPALALDSLAEARRLARRAGHAWALTSSEYVAGKILIDVRRAPEAIVLLAQGAHAAASGGDYPGALALLHAMGGATALVEQHADGATVFGAVDAIGRRYSYNPVAAEGADAQALRDRVASGLTPREFDAAYSRGSGLTLAELLALGASLVPTR